jgi:hypothetical protein
MKVKRPHMIPKGYIRGWADDRSRVEVVDIEHGRHILTSITNATVVAGAYDPSIIMRDLERDFANIENRGIPVIAKLRNGASKLSKSDRLSLITFLDMYLNRGRYADQTRVSAPAAVIHNDGTFVDHELNLGDRLGLSESISGVVRLSELGIEEWQWTVMPSPSALATGDGAVLLFAERGHDPVSTVTFPLSPTQLLVLGPGIERPLPFNELVAQKSRRWIVWAPGTLTLGPNAPIGPQGREQIRPAPNVD